MDNAINVNGDFKTDDSGKIYRIFGTEELKQKIYILLSARLGEFIYDRSLGSEIYSIDKSADDAVDEIISKARHTLADTEYVEVTNASIEDDTVTVSVMIYDNEYDIELRV